MRTAVVGLIFLLATNNLRAAEQPASASGVVPEKSSTEVTGTENRQGEGLASSVSSEKDGKSQGSDKDGLSGVLADVGFAVGVGVIHLSKSDVTETALENGQVRVLGEENDKNGVWLETHFLFSKERVGRKFRHGPFVGVQVDEVSDLLKTVGVGWLISLRYGNEAADSRRAFNLGVGICNTQVRRLGHGFADGQPLPDGMEEIHLRKENTRAGFFMASFTF